MWLHLPRGFTSAPPTSPHPPLDPALQPLSWYNVQREHQHEPSSRKKERAFYPELGTKSCPLPFVFGRMETSQGDREPWRGQHRGLQDWRARECLPRNKIPCVTGFVAFSHRHCRVRSIFFFFFGFFSLLLNCKLAGKRRQEIKKSTIIHNVLVIWGWLQLRVLFGLEGCC